VGTIETIDLTEGDKFDPCGLVSFLDSIALIFKSNNTESDNKYGSITLYNYDIPE
jgi:hypothetical protein